MECNLGTMNVGPFQQNEKKTFYVITHDHDYDMKCKKLSRIILLEKEPVHVWISQWLTDIVLSLRFMIPYHIKR